MKRFPRWLRFPIFAAALLIGLWVGNTDWLDPIHENFHVSAAQAEGYTGHVTGWSSAYVSTLTLDNITAGWRGMIILMSMLGVVCAATGRALPFLTGGFPLGFMISYYQRGFGATDFHSVLKNFVSQNVSPNQVDYVFSRMQADVLQWWNNFGLSWTLITAAVVVALLLIPKRKEAPRG